MITTPDGRAIAVDLNFLLGYVDSCRHCCGTDSAHEFWFSRITKRLSQITGRVEQLEKENERLHERLKGTDEAAEDFFEPAKFAWDENTYAVRQAVKEFNSEVENRKD